MTCIFKFLILGLLLQVAASGAERDLGPTRPAPLDTANQTGAPKKGFRHKLQMNGLERSKESIAIDVPNNSDRPMTIVGVQSTQNLFVVGFDKTIEPGGSGHVTLSYEEQDGSAGGNDYIRLKTNLGVRLVQVDIERPLTVELSAHELVWPVGQAPSTKSVTVTVVNRSTSPKSVRVHGAKNTASLIDLGSGKYRIDITPGSTSEPGVFPTVIEFEPKVPGISPVIVCTVK